MRTVPSHKYECALSLPQPNCGVRTLEPLVVKTLILRKGNGYREAKWLPSVTSGLVSMTH